MAFPVVHDQPYMSVRGFGSINRMLHLLGVVLHHRTVDILESSWKTGTGATWRIEVLELELICLRYGFRLDEVQTLTFNRNDDARRDMPATAISPIYLRT